MPANKSNIHPVVLCGGQGSRLWPLSNQSKPKQFISLPGMNCTLVQNTISRLQQANFELPTIIVQEMFLNYAEEQMQAIKAKDVNIILEKHRNGTAYAATIAAFFLAKYHREDELMLIMPVDHYLEHEDEMFKVINEASQEIGDNFLLFGIKAIKYESAYGYIEVSHEKGRGQMHHIKNFFPSVSQEFIDTYLEQESLYWNSGMILCKISSFLQAMQKLQQQIYNEANHAVKNLYNLQNKFFLPHSRSVENKISLDQALMENSLIPKVMIPVNLEWIDIGSLYAAWEVSKKDQYGNFTSGNTFLMDTQNSYIVSDNPQSVAVLGLKDIFVVNTKDAILVSDKKNLYDVQKLYKQVETPFKKNSKNRHDAPWGYQEILYTSSNLIVKKLYIQPSERTSLQFHQYKREHMLVEKGTVDILIDKVIYTLQPNESIDIPCRSIHRISNNTLDIVVIIEIQTGHVLSEDDVTRLHDDYGRTAN